MPSKIRETHGVHLTLADLEQIKAGRVVEKIIWKDEFENGDVEETLARIALEGVSVFGDHPHRRNRG